MKRLLSREILVLVATIGILALSFSSLADEPPALRGTRRSASPELVRYPAPDPRRVLPAPRATGSNGSESLPRDLFLPPSDTRPLAPLAFEEPPRPPLDALAPPTVPGLAPALWGRFLRRRIEPTDELRLDAGPGEPAGLAASEPGDATDRTAELLSNKSLYDWIRLTSLVTLFGSIVNEDRYGLFYPGREEDPVLFVQVDPETGRERFPGQAPIAYERERVAELGLARTRANEIELRYRGMDGDVTPGSFPERLAFAQRCIDTRHEVPRALELALDVYEELAEFDPEDPAPGIGLARTFEAMFDFESAFTQYEVLLERFPHKADVHVALASLEERCLLLDSAEARLREAVRVERTSWNAHWALGRTLLARGRTEDALEHLKTASRHAPEDPGLLAVRGAMRLDLARAWVRMGRIDSAQLELDDARRLDPGNTEAMAAQLSCAVLEGGSGESIRRDIAQNAEPDGLEFDLLLALGLHELAEGRLTGAHAFLLDAAEDDPLRAPLAWRALSFLFEVAGSTEEAWRYAELAHEGDPLDPWTLFQRGRLLAQGDDLEGAREAFEAALELELDFDEALLALGDVAFRTGRHDEAERYLERAAERLRERPEVFSLRGANALARSHFHDARAAFRRTAELDPDDPVARGGLAWCAYRTGAPEEALVQLAELEDSRRDFPEDDPHRAWARRQVARLSDHLAKVEWDDGFERARLRNAWQVEEGAGPVVELADGEVRIEGAFTRSGRSRLFREYASDQFVSFEARLWIGSESAVRAGLFVGRERRRQHTFETTSEASLARHKDGALEVHLQRSSSDEGEVLKTDEVKFPTDRWVTVRIERGGDEEEPTVNVFLDDVLLVGGVLLPELWRSSRALRVGAFVEGDTGRRALLRLDDVRVVYREEGP